MVLVQNARSFSSRSHISDWYAVEAEFKTEETELTALFAAEAALLLLIAGTLSLLWFHQQL
jgi:hypothetical protein